MNKHSYFDLLLHSNEELENILKCRTKHRETIHEWPLSCVQFIDTTVGKKIYKSEYGPSVETSFLCTIESDIIEPSEAIYSEGLHQVSIRNYIEGENLEQVNLSEKELVTIFEYISGEFSNHNNSVNYYDFSAVDKIQHHIDDLFNKIHDLISGGIFNNLSEKKLGEVSKILKSNEFTNNAIENIGLVHGDLTGENIIYSNGKYMVIDWQRPMLSNPKIDLIKFYTSMKLPMVKAVASMDYILCEFIDMYWAIECKSKWLPSSDDYEKWIISSVDNICKIMETYAI